METVFFKETSDELERNCFKLENEDEIKHSIESDPLEVDSITNDTKPIHQCDQCNEEFKYKCLRSAHIKKVHKEVDIDFYECDFCNETRKDLKYMLSHIETIHEGIRKVKCPSVQNLMVAIEF